MEFRPLETWDLGQTVCLLQGLEAQMLVTRGQAAS